MPVAARDVGVVSSCQVGLHLAVVATVARCLNERFVRPRQSTPLQTSNRRHNRCNDTRAQGARGRCGCVGVGGHQPTMAAVAQARVGTCAEIEARPASASHVHERQMASRHERDSTRNPDSHSCLVGTLLQLLYILSPTLLLHNHNHNHSHSHKHKQNHRHKHTRTITHTAVPEPSPTRVGQQGAPLTLR